MSAERSTWTVRRTVSVTCCVLTLVAATATLFVPWWTVQWRSSEMHARPFATEAKTEGDEPPDLAAATVVPGILMMMAIALAIMQLGLSLLAPADARPMHAYALAGGIGVLCVSALLFAVVAWPNAANSGPEGDDLQFFDQRATSSGTSVRSFASAGWYLAGMTVLFAALAIPVPGRIAAEPAHPEDRSSAQ